MCEIDWDDDGEECRVWREADRKARKQYRCDCCYRPITVGEQYTRHFSVFGAKDAYDEKLCADCKKDRATFAKAHRGINSVPSGFPWMLDGCLADGDEESDRMWRPMFEALNEKRRTHAKAWADR